MHTCNAITYFTRSFHSDQCLYTQNSQAIRVFWHINRARYICTGRGAGYVPGPASVHLFSLTNSSSFQGCADETESSISVSQPCQPSLPSCHVCTDVKSTGSSSGEYRYSCQFQAALWRPLGVSTPLCTATPWDQPSSPPFLYHLGLTSTNAASTSHRLYRAAHNNNTYGQENKPDFNLPRS